MPFRREILFAAYIGGGEGEIIGDVLFGRRFVMLEEARRAAGGEHGGFPLVAGADIGERQSGEALRGVENARQILGAFDIAGQPVQVIGGAREHGYRSSRPSE